MAVADVPVRNGGPSLLCDISSSKPKPIVLPGYRRHVIDLLNELSNPSSPACKDLICSRYVRNRIQKTSHVGAVSVYLVRHKNSETLHGSSRSRSSTSSTVYSRLRTHSESIVHIQRILIYPDDAGPHHTLAGSSSPTRHHSCKLRPCIYDRMGRTLWSSTRNNL